MNDGRGGAGGIGHGTRRQLAGEFSVPGFPGEITQKPHSANDYDDMHKAAQTVPDWQAPTSTKNQRESAGHQGAAGGGYLWGHAAQRPAAVGVL